MSVHRLTIAVPVYNESERVGPALKELLSTSFPVEVEIVIVDDGSVDGTAETIAALPLPDNVHLIKHERNQGKGAALRSADRLQSQVPRAREEDQLEGRDHRSLDDRPDPLRRLSLPQLESAST